jgi:5'-nucleotidase
VTTGQPIRIDRIDERRFAVHGTPADCVRLAIHHLVPGPAWILSGINSGGNLGVDIHHSGTVAAVREAVLHGVPGIAISHYIARGRPIDWTAAARRAHATLASLLGQSWESGTFWNVNLPHPAPGEPVEPSVVFCPVDASPLPLRFAVQEDSAKYTGDYHGRARVPGSDVDNCFRGQITISLVRLLSNC